jgi:hypothetical protein
VSRSSRLNKQPGQSDGKSFSDEGYSKFMSILSWSSYKTRRDLQTPGTSTMSQRQIASDTL